MASSDDYYLIFLLLQQHQNMLIVKKKLYSVIYGFTGLFQEEMSDLRALIRLKEKELRCLEWSLMTQKAQEAVGIFIPESLPEDLNDRKTEQQVRQGRRLIFK